MDRFGHSRTWLSIVFNDTSVRWPEAEASTSKASMLIRLLAEAILLFDRMINLVESSLMGQNKLCNRPKKVSRCR